MALELLLVGLATLACERAPRPAPADAPRGSNLTRVLPASASAVDFAVALAAPERFAGLPVQALEYSLLHDVPASFANTPRFDAYLAEPVLLLAPDVVIADPYQAPETTQRLREAGVRVVTLPIVASWVDARRTLLELGDELGVAARALELCEDLDARVERLAARAAAAPPRRALAYSSFGGVGSTAGAGTTLDDVLRLAGLSNAIAEQGRSGHVDLSFEALLTIAPDVIVVSRPLRIPPSARGDLGGSAERVLLNTPALASLRAVRERRVVALPAWLFATASHEIVTAAEALRDALDELERGGDSTGGAFR